jgi:hypothetical protein
MLMFKRNKENLGKAYKSSSVPTRILGGLFVIIMIVLAWNFILPAMLGKNSIQEEYDSFSDVTGAKINTFAANVEESSTAVIEDLNTESGKLAFKEDEERIAKAKKSQGSAIAALVPVEEEGPNNIADQLAKLAENITGSSEKPTRTAKANTDWITQSRKRSTTPVESSSSRNNANSEELTEPQKTKKDVLADIPSDILEKLIQNEMGSGAAAKAGEIYAATRSSMGYTSSGFVPVKDIAANTRQTENQRGGGQRSANRGEATGSDQKNIDIAGDLPIIIAQGNMLSAESGHPIDSRFNKDFVLRVNSGQLNNATLSCSYTRSNNVLIPTCSDITFKGETAELTAVMLNPMTMGPVIEQYRDDETLLEMMGLLITGAAKVYGENKLQQGTRSEISDTETVTTQDLSDSELVAGSVSTIVGNLSALALQKFAEPDIINVPAKVPMMIALLQPLRANWTFKKSLEPGVDFYEQ